MNKFLIGCATIPFLINSAIAQIHEPPFNFGGLDPALTPPPVLASPAIDGISGTSFGVAASQTVTLSTTSTNDIIIAQFEINGFLFSSVSDTAGLTWALRTSTGLSNGQYEYYAKSPGILTNDVITLTLSGAGFSAVNAFAIKGANYGSPFDTGGAQEAATAPVPITVAKSKSLVFGACQFSVSAPTANTGAGWAPLSSGVSGSFFMAQSHPFSTSGVKSFATNNDGNAGGCTVDAVVSGVSFLTIQDSTNNFAGLYTGYLAPFNGTEITPNTMTVQVGTFPNNTTIAWNYSSTPCAGVCGFLAIDYSNYASGAQIATTPIQVNNIRSLTESHSATFTPNIGAGYDVIDDLFLFSDSIQTARICEFEVFMHTNAPSAAFVAAATQLGTVTISGINWTVAWYPGSPADVLFMPTNQADITIATTDLRAMFLFAKAQGIITGNEWFTGFGFGVEPVANGGVMHVNSFSGAIN